jgi:hypothetical protein
MYANNRCRLPGESKDDASTDVGAVGEHANADGACYKLEEVAQYHVGETVTCMQKSWLAPGGAEAIIYGDSMCLCLLVAAPIFSGPPWTCLAFICQCSHS